MRYAFSRHLTTFATQALAGAALFAGLVLAPEAGAQTLASLPVVPSAVTTARRPSRSPPGSSSARATRPNARWMSRPRADHPDPAIWATIVSVNRRVNKSIQAVTDMDHLHVPDRWDLAEDGSGDCEDFQLLKRKLLAEAGLSAGRCG